MPTIASGFSDRAQRGEDLALRRLPSRSRPRSRDRNRPAHRASARRDALERGLALLVADALAADLARQIAVDGGEPLGDALGDDVVEQDVESRTSAQTCAMPLPIWPAPITPTLRMECAISRQLVARLRPFLDFDHLRITFFEDLCPAIAVRDPFAAHIRANVRSKGHELAYHSLAVFAAAIRSDQRPSFRAPGRVPATPCRDRPPSRNRRPGRSALPRPC